jgi:hypothetical protein
MDTTDGKDRSRPEQGSRLAEDGKLDDAYEAYHRAHEPGDGRGAFRQGRLLSTARDWDGAHPAGERANERGYDDPPSAGSGGGASSGSSPGQAKQLLNYLMAP